MNKRGPSKMWWKFNQKKEKRGNDPMSNTHTLQLKWMNFQQISQVKKPIVKTHKTHMESTMEHIVN
jgi:hypothetical protein